MNSRATFHVDRRYGRTDRETRLVSPRLVSTRLTLLTLLDQLRPDTQRVGAASIRPHPWKCDLLIRALLEEETAVGWSEKEDREGAVQKPGVDVGHEVTWGVSAVTSGRAWSRVERGVFEMVADIETVQIIQ
jgi:hypothetical protein